MTCPIRRITALLALLAPLAAYPAGGWFTSSDGQGLRAFEGHDFGRAAELFADPAWQAAALHREGRYLESAAVLRELATAPARYNRATALALGGEIETAIRLYEALLRDHPDHADARHNLAVLRRHGGVAGENGEPSETPSEAQAESLQQADEEEIAAPEDGDAELSGDELLSDQTQRWLLQVPDDPGGLLRRKFLRQYKAEGVDQDGNALWPGGEAEPW